MFKPFCFTPFELPPELQALRAKVRAFVDARKHAWTGWERGLSWTCFDRRFSLETGREGWIGMTWPKRYGGHERTLLERYVVLEEMLAAGAPVGAHWHADRQCGPLILHKGTEEQRQTFLPQIVRGEIAFCIGMSEPDAGSDLASIRTRAAKVQDGWRINGRKVWTTNAHLADYMVALVRSSGTVADRQAGLSQFLIDLKTPGIEVREIVDLTGDAHFNEVTFDDVFVPDERLVGEVGRGWEQVNGELAFERSGPDRYMSAFPILPLTMDRIASARPYDTLCRRKIGEAAAEFATLREMSVSIAGLLSTGQLPNLEAAVVKELGVTFEQRAPELVRELTSVPPSIDDGDELSAMLACLTQLGPTFSLRGGTREIMRGIMARGLGLR